MPLFSILSSIHSFLTSLFLILFFLFISFLFHMEPFVLKLFFLSPCPSSSFTPPLFSSSTSSSFFTLRFLSSFISFSPNFLIFYHSRLFHSLPFIASRVIFFLPTFLSYFICISVSFLSLMLLLLLYYPLFLPFLLPSCYLSPALCLLYYSYSFCHVFLSFILSSFHPLPFLPPLFLLPDSLRRSWIRVLAFT